MKNRVYENVVFAQDEDFTPLGPGAKPTLDLLVSKGLLMDYSVPFGINTGRPSEYTFQFPAIAGTYRATL